MSEPKIVFLTGTGAGDPMGIKVTFPNLAKDTAGYIRCVVDPITTTAVTMVKPRPRTFLRSMHSKKLREFRRERRMSYKWTYTVLGY